MRKLAVAIRRFGGREETPAERCARALLTDRELTPARTAGHLREIARWLQQVAEATTARARAIEARYGQVFRTASTIHGEYYDPYLVYLAAPEKVAEARRLRAQALALADIYDRRARRQERLGSRADLAVLHERGDTEALLRALDHRDQDTRLRALWFLADLRHPAVVDPLIDMLGDPALTERAAGALGHVGDPRAVEPLISLVRERPDAAGTAMIALGMIGDPRAVDVLLERLDTGLARNTPAGALGKIGDQRAVAPMREILARLRASTPENAAGERLRDLFCESIEDAIREITEANKDLSQ